MTPLRQRIIEELQLRNRAPKTIEAYVLQVRKFAQYYGRSPEQLDAEQVHRYLLYLLHEKKASWVQYNQTVSALRFFYQVTCPREKMVQRLPYGKRRKRLPDVRSPEEVARFLAAVVGECPRLLLRLLYATGLRLGEGLQVRPQDLDDARGFLRVTGKGRKERLVPLPTALVAELKAYAREVKAEPWLFAGKDRRRPIHAATVQKAAKRAYQRAKPAFQAWLSALYAKDWVVYDKKPFASPDVLLKYLTRYTHRVALSNGRLKKVEGDRVTLSYKDYSDGCRAKEMTLTGVELLRRFALHILPKGFVRVRQCGILAHRSRHERLALCRRLLGVPVPLPPTCLIPPAPLKSVPSPVTDRVESAPVELSMAERVLSSEVSPNALPALSMSAVLFLTLALSCDGMGWLLACVSPPPVLRRCPSCGQGQLQTIW